MKLNRKLWTAALAVAMTTPSAMAAQDTAGMHYTSAAEGFYASIRLRYVSNGGTKDGGADIQDSSSRFGVRGTNDLGGGLEGFYQYEAGVSTVNSGCDTEDGDGQGCLRTRVAHVGLRGDFGSVVAGAFWPDSYNFVYGSTDVANRHSGNMTGNFGQYRTSKSIQYTTPDLNGFRGAILLKADAKDGDSDGDGKDDNDIDHWNVAASYDIAGFSTGLSYSRYSDAFDVIGTTLVVLGTVTTASPVTGADHSDKDSWAFKLGYSQDNWYVNGWYGEAEDGYYFLDGGPGRYSDIEVFSLAGGVEVDKIKVYAVYENTEEEFIVEGKKKSLDDSRTTLGVQYTLGSNSWTWVEYAGRDFDTCPVLSCAAEADDFSIGLGHSF